MARPKKIKSNVSYPSARVLHLVLFQLDQDGKLLMSEDLLKEALDSHEGGYVNYAYVLHDKDTYNADAVYPHMYSLFSLIHICDFFNKLLHFLHYCVRAEYLHTSSKSHHPRKERRADFDRWRNGEMVFVGGYHHNVLAELVYNHIR